MGKKIAAIVAEMFEDSEYNKPVDAYRQKGHEVVNIGLEAGETVTGKTEGTKIKIDKSVGDVRVDDFDALLIPGGYSPDQLRVDEKAVQFAAEFVRSDKPVFAICHAGQLLVTAQVLEGRKFTGYKSIIQDIKNAGADFVDQEVVVDRNLVSSRNPGDIPSFIVETLKKL
ncbi:MAG: type 1 glutamine amidotransferase domain-containing protein [Syntrophotaleaceae bacterium]